MRNILQIFIIILGFAAPTFELYSGMCGNIFFDPLPSMLHIIMFYLIPTSMIFIKYFLFKEYSEKRNIILVTLLVYVLVLSIAYSIWFLPISPISVLGIIFFGVGMLGLTPYFLFAVSISFYKQWKKWIPQEGLSVYRKRIAWLLFSAIPVMIILWWNPIFIKIGESELKSSNVESKYTGLNILKHLTAEEELRKSSFNTNRDFFLSDRGSDPKLLREAYYYIYGVRPGISEKTGGLLGERRWEFDVDQGSSNIGKKLSGLLLGESAIDINSRFNENYNYYEWTMVFENKSVQNKEARAIVQLPPNSMVSKVSLWIDGEEREAAFGTSSKVKSAYRQVVRRQRDPLLVTMLGPDQLMVQCFPVPSEGDMKIRLGITSAMFESDKVILPRFVEANFTVEDSFKHSVWIEADKEFLYNNDNTYRELKISRIQLSNDDLNNPSSYYKFPHQVKSEYAASDGSVIIRTFTPDITGTKPVLLIDGSKRVINRIKNLRLNPDDFSEVIMARPFDYEQWDKGSDLNNFIAGQTGYGGVNPTPALVKALDMAEKESTSILWIHGACPTTIRQELEMEQYFRRSSEHINIITLNLSEQMNAYITDLTFMSHFIPSKTLGDVMGDYERALRVARIYATKDIDSNNDKIFLAGRYHSGYELILKKEIENSHSYRLYLYSRIMRQWFEKGEITDKLTKTAVYNRLVTPVTGAVVLENTGQYERANLDPSLGSENIPTIPEPEFYILLAISIVITAYYLYSRKRIYV